MVKALVQEGQLATIRSKPDIKSVKGVIERLRPITVQPDVTIEAADDKEIHRERLRSGGRRFGQGDKRSYHLELESGLLVVRQGLVSGLDIGE